MPRFVLLRHEFPAGDARASHWDLMLEHEGRLRTWALASLPESWRGVLGGPAASTGGCGGGRDGTSSFGPDVQAQRLPDHRLTYLHYEGPVSRGRGHVKQCDTGTYELLSEEPSHLDVNICGSRLTGRISLRRTADSHWEMQLRGAPEGTG